MAQNFVTWLNPIIATVSGAATFGPYYLKTEQVDHWDIIADWTGTIAGTFKVEAGGGVRDVANIAGGFAGKWTDVSARFVPPLPVPAGAAGNGEISAVFWTAPWMRLTFTASGGAGTLTLWPSGKKS